MLDIGQVVVGPLVFRPLVSNKGVAGQQGLVAPLMGCCISFQNPALFLSLAQQFLLGLQIRRGNEC